MDFYAMAYQFQEGIFYDHAKGDLTHDLQPTCFLPTKELAEQIIKDEHGEGEFIPVKITMESLRDGVWAYTRERVANWDEGYEEEE